MPVGDFNPLDFDPVIGGHRAARFAQPWRRPASPERAESFSKQAGHMALSGLGYVLSTLDKPGRAVRSAAGLLAGMPGAKPRELLAAVPLSDTFHWTDPEDAVSGARLNQHVFGLKDDNSWKSWGAGIGTELVTDPLSYMTFGTKHALTAAGKAAEKQGLLRGMTRARKVKGFEHAEDALRAAGENSEQIAHRIRQGHTVAPAGSGIGSGQPLAGVARVGLPFGGPGITLGTGSVGQTLARGGDRLGEALAYRVPGAKSLSALFDPAVGRATDEVTQRGMRAAGTPAREAAEATGRGQRYAANQVMRDIVEQGEATGHWDEGSAQTAARMFALGLTPSPHLPKVHNDLWAAVQRFGPFKAEFARHFPEGQALGLPTKPLQDPFIKDYFPRQGAKPAEAGVGPQMKGGNLSKTTGGHDIARKKWSRGIPGGDVMLQKWSEDPTLAGAGAAAAAASKQAVLNYKSATYWGTVKGLRTAANMAKKMLANPSLVLAPAIRADLVALATASPRGGGVISPALRQILGLPAQAAIPRPATIVDRLFADMLGQAAHQGVTLPNVDRTVIDKTTKQAVTTTLDHAAQLKEKAAKVARRLGRHDPASGPIFARDIIGDIERRNAQTARATGGAAGFYAIVGESARRLQPGMEPASKLLRGIKQHDKRIRLGTTEGGPLGIQGALVEMHKALAKQGAGPTEDFVRKAMAPVAAATTPKEAKKALKAAVKQLKGEVDRYGFRPEQAASILKDYAAWRAPEEVVRPMKVVDSFTNMFRNMAYSLWLPSHVRNAAGGMVQAATQPYAPGIRDYLQAKRLLGDNSPAAQAIKGEAFQHGKVFSGFNPAETQAARAATGKITPDLPGSAAPVNPLVEMGKGAFQTGKEVAKHPIKSATFGPGSPLEQLGVREGTKNFPLLEAGRKVGTQTEDWLRMAQYLGMKRQGLAPAEAGRRVLETHFDYSKLTPFERTVMRRAIPFYSFMRNNLPLQLENLTRRPGQTVLPQLRVTAPRPDQVVPSHLASGVAIPMGQEDERGNQQYISQLGLPIEEAFERMKFHPGDPLGMLRDTALAYGGTLNPLIKGPLEQLFDTQLFSGRKLSDLRPQGAMGTLGSLLDPDARHPQALQLASQAVANTPATRFATAIDKLADPRKAWWQKALNLGTGVRVSDVDMEKTRAIESRKLLESILRGNPAISRHLDFYVRPEDRERLDPQAIANMQLYSLMQSNAQRAAKQRRSLAMQGATPSP